MTFPVKLIIPIVCCGLLAACVNDSDSTQKEAKVETGNQHSNSEEQNEKDERDQHEAKYDNEEPNIVLQNDAFKIFEPAPHSKVSDQIVIRGLARVFEATIQYEFEDGHDVLDKGFTTASVGAPGWGEFELIIELDDETEYSGSIFLYEESAKDGSRLHELEIPVHVK